MSDQPSLRELARGLFEELEKRGLLEYGSAIPSELVHELLDITVPQYAAKAVYDRLSMLELSAIDYCRNVLLGQGKYLSGTRTGYRVLLPSENKGQIDSYVSSADRKLSRALKLSRSSPVDASHNADQTSARIMLKKSGVRNQPGATPSC